MSTSLYFWEVAKLPGTLHSSTEKKTEEAQGWNCYCQFEKAVFIFQVAYIFIGLYYLLPGGKKWFMSVASDNL